jgi:hypothetical protein
MSDKEQYPEHEKIKNLHGVNQTVGDFIEWLHDSKSVHFVTRHRHTDDLCGGNSRYPTCGYDERSDEPVFTGTEELLAEFFNIDLKKLEQEKRTMLETMKTTAGYNK